MLRQIKIKPKALKQLQSLEKLNQQRIITKIEYYASLPNPKDYAEVLVDFAYGTYRYRIGDYRVIVDFDDEGMMIIVGLIGNRREIYKS